MKGLYYLGSNKAMMQGCDESTAKTMYQLPENGSRIKWPDYAKKYMPEWEFNIDQDPTLKVAKTEKFRKVWKKCGSKICEAYNKNYGIPIIFDPNFMPSGG